MNNRVQINETRLTRPSRTNGERTRVKRIISLRLGLSEPSKMRSEQRKNERGKDKMVMKKDEDWSSPCLTYPLHSQTIRNFLWHVDSNNSHKTQWRTQGETKSVLPLSWRICNSGKIIILQRILAIVYSMLFYDFVCKKREEHPAKKAERNRTRRGIVSPPELFWFTFAMHIQDPGRIEWLKTYFNLKHIFPNNFLSTFSHFLQNYFSSPVSFLSWLIYVPDPFAVTFCTNVPCTRVFKWNQIK